MKWTATQIKEQIQRIQKVIEKQKRENKNEHFTSLTPEEIEQKLKRVNSPMITSQSWNDTTPGGTVSCQIGIYNPDPIYQGKLFVHVWIGPGNVDPTLGTFLLNVDTRFPRLTQPNNHPGIGLGLAAGASATISFALKVPATVEKTTYLGNSCLMQIEFHDVGKYLDRSVFPFSVT